VKNNLSRKFVILFLILLIIAISLWQGKKYLQRKKTEKSDIEKYYPETTVKLSVLNGSGIDFAARNVRSFILDNFDRVMVINAKNVRGGKYNFNKTIIVVRKRNKEKKLKYLQALTGIKRRILAYNKDGNEEFYIIVGRDYKKYFSKKEKYGK
jgi:hypothetical protein